MCEASRMLEHLPTAAVGESVVIKMGGHIRPSKMFARAATPSCIVCVPFGAVVSFQTLPGSIQARLRTKGPIEARMVSFDLPRTEFTTNRDDVFEVETADGDLVGRFLLSELPVGTVCEVLRIQEMPSNLSEQILAGADPVDVSAFAVPVSARSTRERFRDLVRA